MPHQESVLDPHCHSLNRHRAIQPPGSWRLAVYHAVMSASNLPATVTPDVLARARKIKLFLMDVDGTLTDGGVCLISTTAADGEGKPIVSEMKVFNAQDGQGLSLAHTMGIQTGFITGRRSPAVARRAEELKVSFVYLGQASKTQALKKACRRRE